LSKIAIFNTPPAFDDPVRGTRPNIAIKCLAPKTIGGSTRWWKKINDMFSYFDTIPACDGQMDRQTSCDSIVRAMHTRRAIKTQQRTDVD